MSWTGEKENSMDQKREELALKKEKSIDQKREALALKILDMARTKLLLHMRFFSRALMQLEPVSTQEWSIACDGEHLYFDPAYVLIRYREDPSFSERVWLHVLVHCLFAHAFTGQGIDQELWNLACDIFAEGMCISLYPAMSAGASSPQHQYRRQEAEKLCRQIRPFSAERIYRKLMDDPLRPGELREWKELFALDDHRLWTEQEAGQGAAGKKGNRKHKTFLEAQEEIGDASETSPDTPEGTKAVWKRISANMENELLSWSRQQGERSGDFVRALEELHREKADYQEFLRKFAARSEVMHVSLEDFDYIFYTYGLELYKDTPLIESLEYREDRKIRDFVIVIDTSGSVSGEKVQRFLQETWNVLKSEESFSHQFLLHILQCDASVRQDDVITNQREFDQYVRDLHLSGFGGTDFRLAFAYVDQLVKEHHFRDLKGLLYFTDGLGTFPEKRPDYLTAFVFVDQESHSLAKVPAWAISAVLDGGTFQVY